VTAQSASLVHGPIGQPGSTPSQATPTPQAGVPGEPAGCNEHVPAVRVHDWQAPVHALSQQTPSVTMSLAHSAVLLEGCPFLSLHAPVASQVMVPVQLSMSSAFVMVSHTPVPVAQPMHVPLQAPEHQLPFVQMPEAQSTTVLQAPPGSVSA
jgi:hypothetical protein